MDINWQAFMHWMTKALARFSKYLFQNFKSTELSLLAFMQLWQPLFLSMHVILVRYMLSWYSRERNSKSTSAAVG